MRLSFRDQALPMRVPDQRFDQGNREFVMSMPAGTYEAEEDGGDLMRIFRRVGDERELVLMLPAGDYTLETDGQGSHLYREPDGSAPVVQPLGDARRARDAQLSGSAGEFVTLRAVNERNARHYAGDRRPPTPHKNPEHRTLQQINEANRRRFGGDAA